MRQMPFGGAGVGVRLECRVGVGQWFGQRQRQRASLRQPGGKTVVYWPRVAPGCHSTSPPSAAATERAATNKWSDSRLR